SSGEARTVLVQDLYIRLLGREADPFGLSTYVTFLNQGGTIEQVKSQLMGSNEYFMKAGFGDGDNQSWLESVYEDALGRLPDAFGEGQFLAALSNGTPRDQVALTILTSDEGYTRLVTNYYRDFLDRMPDNQNLAFWVGF